MNGAPRPHPTTLLGSPEAPRVVLTAVVLLLGIPFAPTGDAGWRSVHDIGVLAFCAWIWAPRRWRRRLGLALGVSLLAGAALDPSPGIDILTVTGVTALVRSVRPRWGLLVVGVVAVLLVARLWVATDDVTDLATSAAQTVLIVFVLVLLDHTASVTRELVATTHALVGEQVDQERARLGERLRPLIGRTLAAARQDVHEAVRVADQADHDLLDELRSLASLLDDGLGQLERLTLEPVSEGLQSELAAAREVCERLGIRVTVSADEVPDPAVADVVALVLREAVTNMLKHSDAGRCVIVVRVSDTETVLAVTNDGASPVSTASRSGTGQRRWREALAALGGELTTNALDDGRYQILVRVPQASGLARR